MALTEDQKKQLNAQCDRMPVLKIVEYIDKGFVNFPDDLPSLSDDRKKAIQDILDSRPNPQEQREWNDLAPLTTNLDDGLKNALNSYISHWESRKPVGNHLEEAGRLLEAIRQKEIEQRILIEKADWDLVDQADKQSLLGHKQKYPESGHMQEIEDALWTLVNGSENIPQEVEEFLQHFPDSKYKTQAQQILSSYQEWQDIKDEGDLLSTFQYLQNHPDSPFANDARLLLLELKGEELQTMRELLANYPIENLFYYLDNGIYTEDELIAAEVATSESLEIIRKFEKIKGQLPDVNAEIAKCKKVCAEGHTDVFLFGIPSTGKSCILMGLIGSPQIEIDPIRAAGPYSDVLQQYLDAGLTIGQTPKNFVATIEACISDMKEKHLLNLVEMSGEDFAFKMADNENGKISFEDMGNGATRLLCNDNHKVFFIIVDPTARVVAFNHLVEDGENSYLVRKNVNQRVTLNRMIGLLRQPENKKILKKVESIHIIMTKSDTLGTPDERDQKAMEHFTKHYQGIVKPLTQLCLENGINRRTNGMPKLYTFSLGKFYVGGVYKYDQSDANKLIQVLKHDTESIGNGGFFDKVRNVFN